MDGVGVCEGASCELVHLAHGDQSKSKIRPAENQRRAFHSVCYKIGTANKL